MKIENIEYYFFGFSRWKRKHIKLFFHPLKHNKIIFCNTLDEAIDKGLNSQSKIYIWGKKLFSKLENYAKKKNIEIVRVEDGFIRSVSLGVDFSQPYSLIVDTRGIYFDATKESDLEHILNYYKFDNYILKRANSVKDFLVQNRISKYNIYKDKKISIKKKDKNQKTILVVGQVEGDASLIYGANNMKNIELLKAVKKDNKDDYIIYKPHPDVLNGNREGNIEDTIALKYCNKVEKEISIDSLLEVVDEVHTMTSLVGIEALIRDKKVVCYGMPFYAGWGLTTDKKSCNRRNRKLTLNELIAGAYILYPRYIDPISLEGCEIERVLEVLAKEKELYHKSMLYRSKIKVKNFIYKKYYALLRHLLKD